MAIPEPTLKVYEMTRIDLAISDFTKIENPSIADLDRIKVQADIQDGIDAYRFDAIQMNASDLRAEAHISGRLATMMQANGDPRPAAGEHCHCHAIVSGAHNDAAIIRAVLAWAQMRIDDPRNGCWLPRNTKAKKYMPSWLISAVPHSRIHRKSYYRWLRTLINPQQIKSSNDLVRTLKMVRVRLQSGSLPIHIMKELGM